MSFQVRASENVVPANRAGLALLAFFCWPLAAFSAFTAYALARGFTINILFALAMLPLWVWLFWVMAPLALKSTWAFFSPAPIFDLTPETLTVNWGAKKTVRWTDVEAFRYVKMYIRVLRPEFVKIYLTNPGKKQWWHAVFSRYVIAIPGMAIGMDTEEAIKLLNAMRDKAFNAR
jgi:hypothetical protein